MATGSRKHDFEENRFEKAVSRNFICSVCLCVLKDPKMCRNNEHVFCSHCITKHLEHSSRCPECGDSLTVETLKRPPRLLLNFLSELSVEYDYYSCGYREYVQLEELPKQAMNNDFAPVLCSNQHCGMHINKREYRHKCHDCTEIRRQMDEIKTKMAEAKRDIAKLKTEMAESRAKVDQDLTKVTTEVKKSLAELHKEFRGTTGEILRNINVTQPSPHVKLAAEQEDIAVAGGFRQSRPLTLKSVETFSWQTRSWTPLPPMKEPHSNATSFVYNNQIFVAGGLTDHGATDSVEVMNIHGEAVQWETFPAKLPIKVYNHKTVVYQNRLIVVGGWNCTLGIGKRSDVIYEVLLTPPYSTKLLRRMPEARSMHGAQLINDKVFILGGRTDNGLTDSVLMYDVARNECKQMPSLPYAVWYMSTVSWRDKVILLGGWEKNDKCLNDVLMYDTLTGETVVLPPMKHKRSGSSAVVTGDRIIIMAGWNGKGYLKSVECYSFSSNSWQKLPPMTDRRYGATAVVKPGNIY